MTEWLTFHENNPNLYKLESMTKWARHTDTDSIWIYFIQEAESDLFKIGFSNNPRNHNDILNRKYMWLPRLRGVWRAARAKRVPRVPTYNRRQGCDT